MVTCCASIGLLLVLMALLAACDRTARAKLVETEHYRFETLDIELAWDDRLVPSLMPGQLTLRRGKGDDRKVHAFAYINNSWTKTHRWPSPVGSLPRLRLNENELLGVWFTPGSNEVELGRLGSSGSGERIAVPEILPYSSTFWLSGELVVAQKNEVQVWRLTDAAVEVIEPPAEATALIKGLSSDGPFAVVLGEGMRFLPHRKAVPDWLAEESEVLKTWAGANGRFSGLAPGCATSDFAVLHVANVLLFLCANGSRQEVVLHDLGRFKYSGRERSRSEKTRFADDLTVRQREAKGIPADWFTDQVGVYPFTSESVLVHDRTLQRLVEVRRR